MTRLTRRALLFRAAPLAAVAIGFTRSVRAADSCVQPDSESLRASLNYVSSYANAAETCARCAYFTADAAPGDCGACQLFGGPVDVTGHCDSFSAPA